MQFNAIMKKLLSALVMTILVFGMASGAFAYPYSGEWMFTLSGNDSNYGVDNLESAIENWFESAKNETRDVDLVFYDKVDQGQSSENGLMTLTYGAGNLYGTWATESPIEFYSVKAGTEFAFYWLSTPLTEGFWTTEHLHNKGGKVPAISHLSAWNATTAEPPVATPEPGTLILLGMGLLGVLGIARKKFRR